MRGKNELEQYRYMYKHTWLICCVISFRLSLTLLISPTNACSLFSLIGIFVLTVSTIHVIYNTESKSEYTCFPFTVLCISQNFANVMLWPFITCHTVIVCCWDPHGEAGKKLSQWQCIVFFGNELSWRWIIPI